MTDKISREERAMDALKRTVKDRNSDTRNIILNGEISHGHWETIRQALLREMPEVVSKDDMADWFALNLPKKDKVMAQFIGMGLTEGLMAKYPNGIIIKESEDE